MINGRDKHKGGRGRGIGREGGREGQRNGEG